MILLVSGSEVEHLPARHPLILHLLQRILHGRSVGEFEFGRQFGQRLQHEAPLGHSGMRELQPVEVKRAAIVPEDVHIQRARAPAVFGPHPAGVPFEAVKRGQQPAGIEPGLDLDHQFEEISLLFEAHGSSFIEMRVGDYPGFFQAVEFLDGARQNMARVALIRAETKKYPRAFLRAFRIRHGHVCFHYLATSTATPTDSRRRGIGGRGFLTLTSARSTGKFSIMASATVLASASSRLYERLVAVAQITSTTSP